MVARCLRGENRFGVIAIRQGAEVGAATTYETGTSAEIVDWQQEPGGLLGVLAVGREPFRLLEARREPDGLYVGSVEWLPEPPRLPLAPAFAPLASGLRRLIEPLAMYRDAKLAFDDAAWVGGRLIELLPLDLALKQSLLELANVEQRLERLAAALERRGESE
jgi:hypothetical protein